MNLNVELVENDAKEVEAVKIPIDDWNYLRQQITRLLEEGCKDQEVIEAVSCIQTIPVGKYKKNTLRDFILNL